MGHIKMMGAVQPFISGAISKTVNMPHESTVDDIADAYIEAWRLGVKALAIYRDGSKTAQALRTDAQQSAEPGGRARGPLHQEQVDELVEEAVDRRQARGRPARKRMPRERQSITHKFSIGGHEGYITAGMYEDGTVGEIFLTDIGKEGSTLRGMMNSFATAISIVAAVRRAARDAGAEVQLHALRAGRDHAEPGDPVREVDARLHHALARDRASWTPTPRRSSASSRRRSARGRRRRTPMMSMSSDTAGPATPEASGGGQATAGRLAPTASA